MLSMQRFKVSFTCEILPLVLGFIGLVCPYTWEVVFAWLFSLYQEWNNIKVNVFVMITDLCQSITLSEITISLDPEIPLCLTN